MNAIKKKKSIYKNIEDDNLFGNKSPEHVPRNECPSSNYNQIMIHRCYELICKGYLYNDILSTLVEEFGISRNNAIKKYTIAKKQLTEEIQKEKTEMKDLLITRLLDVYKEARLSNDRLSALSALDKIIKIGQLDKDKDENFNATYDTIEINFKV